MDVRDLMKILPVYEKTEYGYSIGDVKKITDRVWKRIRSKVHQLFDDGSPTCTYATMQLGKEYEKRGVRFRVASGEYTEGTGHWWIIVYAPKVKGESVTKWVVDLGNNIDPKAIKTGKITPVLSPFPVAGYKAEHYTSYQQFLPHV